ncbi:MAG: phenylacetic acid degradation protein [Rhizobacter sp.]|nr:phenylacetic acid degradation protein [Rhizobacter sp.]
MLRSDITLETLHARQEGKLPGHYGFTVTEIAEGKLNAEMAVQSWMLAPNGFLHAASVILLADTACGYATFAHLPEGAKGFTTIELKSNFLGTALSGVIRAEAVGEHIGRTTQVWSANVFNGEGKRMAMFRCTQMVLI